MERLLQETGFTRRGTAWGTAPTVCEGITARVTVSTVAQTAKVYALDDKGGRIREVPVELSSGALSFPIGPENQTLWYEVAAE